MRTLLGFCLMTVAFFAVAQSTIDQPANLAIDQAERASWNNRHAEGWFWRDVDPEVIEPEETDEPIQPALVNPNTLYPDMSTALEDPLVTLEVLQKAVETSKARAVLQPTQENIFNWIKVQNELLRKNTLLADNWQRLVWKNPDYDYNQVRPHNPVALKAYSQSYKDDRRTALKDIAKEYGLYFVISASCVYCHEMAPYLKRFADAYGFTVIAITVDGGSVNEFPEALYSPQFAEELGVESTPAIILAKPSEGVIEPISYGFISLKELESRIYRIFKLEPGEPNYRVPTTGLQ